MYANGSKGLQEGSSEQVRHAGAGIRGQWEHAAQACHVEDFTGHWLEAHQHKPPTLISGHGSINTHDEADSG